MSLTFYVQSNLTLSVELDDLQQLANENKKINYSVTEFKLNNKTTKYFFRMPWITFRNIVTKFILSKGYDPYNSFLFIQDYSNLSVNFYLFKNNSDVVRLPHNSLINIFVDQNPTESPINSILIEFVRNITPVAIKGQQYGIRDDMLIGRPKWIPYKKFLDKWNKQKNLNYSGNTRAREGFSYDDPDSDPNTVLWIIIILLIIGGAWGYYKYIYLKNSKL
jgi:hypothetical protein